MLPYTRGAYVNYLDLSLDNPFEDYYGSNLSRLVEIKRKYDPENFFNAPHSLPLSLNSRSNTTACPNGILSK
jgi:hypothetical protein